MPAGTELATLIPTCEVPEPGAAIDVGLIRSDTPAGCPEALREMELLKLPAAAVVTLNAAPAPWVMLRAAGVALRVKSLEPTGELDVTIKVRVAECVAPFPLAVRLSG